MLTPTLPELSIMIGGVGLHALSVVKGLRLCRRPSQGPKYYKTRDKWQRQREAPRATRDGLSFGVTENIFLQGNDFVVRIQGNPSCPNEFYGP